MNTFSERLLAWYDEYGRHDLPWQQPRSPYRVWLAEIMLQQTQVDTVIPYFQRFVRALPELPALAAAELDFVMALWSGLGYYNRAHNLHRCAQRCMLEHGQALPTDFASLSTLPGIGRSTAGAILAQAYGQRYPILDGNVRRVLCRWHGIDAWPGLHAVQVQLWTLAESLLPHRRLADYTQAQMDLGATVCTRSKPRCERCPLQGDCVAYARGMQARLPAARTASSPRPERVTCMLLLRDCTHRLLLQRRPPTGIWPCLWSLPEAATPEAAELLARRLAVLPAPLTALGEPLRHSFTHFHLRITALAASGVQARQLIGDNQDFAWIDSNVVGTLGLPAPVRRLIERMSASVETA